MYTKNDGWIYFDSVEELTNQGKSDKKEGRSKDEDWIMKLWQYDFYFTYWNFIRHYPDFSCAPEDYRRKLTPEFKARTEFKQGDKVCWCGCNGVVNEIIDDYISCYIEGDDCDKMFTKDGKSRRYHKSISLFHGHDVLRAEDQKFPVEKIYGKSPGMIIEEAIEELDKAAKAAFMEGFASINELRGNSKAMSCSTCTFSVGGCPRFFCSVHERYKEPNDTCIAWQKEAK